MTHAAPYRIHRIRKKHLSGVTITSSCTLNAILKFDSPESQHCVYNEHVALKLAQTLHIPVADGVLTSTGDGTAYASLEVGSPGIALPDLLGSQIHKVADQYSDEVAALVAFDIFIGNWDRGRNIKASLVTPHLPTFRAFDHSHALLNIAEDPNESVERLRKGELIVNNHPFYGYVSDLPLTKWIARITSTSDVYIIECCYFGRTFRAVSKQTQQDLAAALIERKKILHSITEKYHSIIRVRP